MYILLLNIVILMLCLSPLCAQSVFKNIEIGNEYNPNETTIAIDPLNPRRLVAAANLQQVFYSSDSGRTWKNQQVVSTLGVWGDPVIVADYSGNFYYFHLSNPQTDEGNWIDRIVCQKSTDGGATWSDGTFTGLNGSKAQDKHWVTVNPQNNHLYVTWTQFDAYGSRAPDDSSIIRFSKSTDGGQTWSDAIRLSQIAGNCVDDDSTTEGAVPAIGPNGELYVAWAGPAGIMFDRSFDDGETWLKKDIFVDEMPGGWNFDIPGIYRANGMPVTVCDRSGGPHHGTVYLNWADQRNGADDTDIWLAKSTDHGNTWSRPVRVNDDPAGKQQFFSWITIDQNNGHIYVVFYDRRNYEDELTDVYLAVSKDGGASFENVRISASPFFPNANVFFGDYTNIAVHNGMIRPIWTRLQNSQLSTWTALIDATQIPTAIAEQKQLPAARVSLEQNYPNPFDTNTYIAFKLHEPSHISLKIYDTLGKQLATIIDHKYYAIGKFIESFNAREYNLSSGSYFSVIENNGNVLMRKMIYVK